MLSRERSRLLQIKRNNKAKNNANNNCNQTVKLKSSQSLMENKGRFKLSARFETPLHKTTKAAFVVASFMKNQSLCQACTLFTSQSLSTSVFSF